MFFFLPIHDTQKLTECFRPRLIKFFLSKNLIGEEFASTFLCGKNSGFSVNNSVRIGAVSTRIDTLNGNKPTGLFAHEFGHVFIVPYGHSQSLSIPITIMKNVLDMELPGPAG
jgi:hypothetical protein